MSTTKNSQDPGFVRAAIRAGVIGNLVDQLHIFLPVLALAPALPVLYATADSPNGSSIGPSIALVVMALLIGRPVGAIIFGQIADHVGRTRTTQIAIGGTAFSTLLLGLTPSVQLVGGLTPWWILLCRFAGGVFLAGEYSAAIPLAMEWSKPRLRGWFSGLIMAMAPLAQSLIAFVTFGLLWLVGDDTYSHGVWRLSFFAGALASLGVLILYRRTVSDHPEVTRARKTAYAKSKAGNRRSQQNTQSVTASSAQSVAMSPQKPSLTDLLWGSSSRTFWHMFVLMSGMWCMTQMVAILIAQRLGSQVHLDARSVSLVMAAAAIAQGIAMALVGHASTLTRRRPMFIGWGIFATFAGPAAWYWAVSFGSSATVSIIQISLAVIVLQVVTVPIYGPVGAYLAEGFTAAVRSSGYGIAYSASIVLPALYPYYLPVLENWVGVLWAPMCVLALGGILVTVGALLGPRKPLVDENTALRHEATTSVDSIGSAQPSGISNENRCTQC